MKVLKSLGMRLLRGDRRLPEPALWRYLYWSRVHQLVTELDIECVIDVGANVGQFAQGLRATGYDGWILSFEPVSSAYETLCINLASDTKWRGFHLALGDRDAETEIMVPQASSAMSSLRDPIEPWVSVKETVAMRRLDGLLSTFDSTVPRSRLFLKMDTQGFDLQVFRGSAGIQACIMALQSELAVLPDYIGAPEYLEALHAYQDEGFVLDGLFEIARSGADRRLSELDALLVRRDLQMPAD